MSVLSDSEIRKLCLCENPMLDPFSEGEYKDGEISYGLSSGGYDIRLSGLVWIYKNTSGLAVNPKKFRDEEYRRKMFDEFHFPPGGEITIPSQGYVLAESLEHFRIPRHLIARCVGKSTFARCGITINVTPLEPEWQGRLVIEIANDNPAPAVVFSHEGIAQIQFELIHGNVEKSYADKNAGRAGKYQNQSGITTARV